MLCTNCACMCVCVFCVKALYTFVCVCAYVCMYARMWACLLTYYVYTCVCACVCILCGSLRDEAVRAKESNTTEAAQTKGLPMGQRNVDIMQILSGAQQRYESKVSRSSLWVVQSQIALAVGYLRVGWSVWSVHWGCLVLWM